MSCNGGGCVAVDDTAEDGTVYLTSTRRPEAEPLAIDADEWIAFLADVTAGRYGGDCPGLPECAGPCCRSWEELHPGEIM